ncbi:MAG: 50S ribosomal protein L17 [Lentisphaerae bacterium]|nr:50S ribosomal protein L17 [Lentisphaerota bacterium]
MRHKKKDRKLGRSSSHRKALMAALVCSLIEEKRIKTTLMKAKEAQPIADKMVTLGRRGTLASRRNAIAEIRREKIVAKLFNEIVPQFADRHGGYTRIVKLGRRRSDGSEMAILEWVGIAVPDKKKKKKTEKPEKTDAAA